MLGPVLGAFSKLSHVSLNHNPVSRNCYYPHITNEETKSGRVSNFPRWHSRAEIVRICPPSTLTCPLFGARGRDGGPRPCCPLGIPAQTRKVWRSWEERKMCVAGAIRSGFLEEGEGEVLQ